MEERLESCMKDLAPDIVRQRLLIEGLFTREIDEAAIEEYFDALTKALGLKMYAKPMIHSPGGEGKAENQGYDAFVPLIDSGISAYVWSNAKFFSILIYSCKRFDEALAVGLTGKFFGSSQIEHRSF